MAKPRKNHPLIRRVWHKPQTPKTCTFRSCVLGVKAIFRCQTTNLPEPCYLRYASSSKMLKIWEIAIVKMIVPYLVARVVRNLTNLNELKQKIAAESTTNMGWQIPFNNRETTTVNHSRSKDELLLHIHAKGDWTVSLYRYFLKQRLLLSAKYATGDGQTPLPYEFSWGMNVVPQTVCFIHYKHY